MYHRNISVLTLGVPRCTCIGVKNTRLRRHTVVSQQGNAQVARSQALDITYGVYGNVYDAADMRRKTLNVGACSCCSLVFCCLSCAVWSLFGREEIGRTEKRRINTEGKTQTNAVKTTVNKPAPEAGKDGWEGGAGAS